MNCTAASLMCLVIAGCTAAADSRIQNVQLGADVTLAPGESGSVREAGLTVRFVSVIEDSRCPRDVTCVWAGEVQARTEIQERSKAPTQRDLKIGEYADAGGYRVTLVSVEPQPTSTVPIQPQDYRATIRLAKLAETR